MPLDISDNDVKEMFAPFGENDEVYFDKTKGFAFVRLVRFICTRFLYFNMFEILLLEY